MGNIKLVVLDLDGTVVKYSGRWHCSWDAIAVASGTKEEQDKLCDHYYPRKDKYDERLQKNAELLVGIKISEMGKSIFPPPYADGVKDAVRFFKDKNCICGLFSSGVDFVADRIKSDLSLDFSVANKLDVSDGAFTGAAKKRVHLLDKGKRLAELANEFNIPLSQVLFIGDEENDISAMDVCGHSIAFNPNTSEVRDAADVSFDCWHKIREYVENEFFN
ncbi:MAG: HAD-IB family phosphatase [Nanohaloarchaea archaeon]|nr:HAD-IB family phosphatase [Candidatus Nanohaloarchaea archaeon]